MTRQIRQFTPDKRTQALHRAEEVGAARAGKEPESATYRGIRKPIHLWPTHTQVWVARARLHRQVHLCGAHVVSNYAPLLRTHAFLASRPASTPSVLTPGGGFRP